MSGVLYPVWMPEGEADYLVGCCGYVYLPGAPAAIRREATIDDDELPVLRDQFAAQARWLERLLPRVWWNVPPRRFRFGHAERAEEWNNLREQLEFDRASAAYLDGLIADRRMRRAA